MRVCVLGTIVGPGECISCSTLRHDHGTLRTLSSLSGNRSGTGVQTGHTHRQHSYGHFFNVIGGRVMFCSRGDNFCGCCRTLVSTVRGHTSIIVRCVAGSPSSTVFRATGRGACVGPCCVNLGGAVPLVVHLRTSVIIVAAPSFGGVFVGHSMVGGSVRCVCIPRSVVDIRVNFHRKTLSRFSAIFYANRRMGHRVETARTRCNLPRGALIRFNCPLTSKLTSLTTDTRRTSDNVERVLVTPS